MCAPATPTIKQTHTHTNTHTHTKTHLHLHYQRYVSTNIYVYMYMYMHGHMSIDVYTYMCIYIYMYIYVCVYKQVSHLRSAARAEQKCSLAVAVAHFDDCTCVAVCCSVLYNALQRVAVRCSACITHTHTSHTHTHISIYMPGPRCRGPWLLTDRGSLQTVTPPPLPPCQNTHTRTHTLSDSLFNPHLIQYAG